MKRLLPLLALCALALPARAAIDLETIKPDGFARAVTFTVAGYTNETGASRSTLSNFPVLVRLSAGSPSGFAYSDVLLPSGADIRFKAADGTVLAHEIDTWDDTGTSLIWVTLPSMANGTEFAMFYGASASDAAAVAVGNAWTDYTGVWHLGETGSGSSRTIYDSTTNSLTGTPGSNSSYLSGVVGGAQKISTQYNKTTEQITVSLGATGSAKRQVVDALVPQFTISLWYRTTSTVGGSIAWMYLIGRRQVDKDSNGGWAIQLDDFSGTAGCNKHIRLWSNEGSSDCRVASRPDYSDYYLNGTWNKLDIVYDNTKWYLYHDGTLYRSGDFSAPPKSGSRDLGLGGGVAVKSQQIRPLYGDMDEVRLRRGTVSADWVAADYATQTSASFLTGGTVEQVGESENPVASFNVADTGAAFVQFDGTVTALGGDATECSVYAKAWPTGETEPATWTLIASGIGEGGSYSGFLTGLEPLAEYTYAIKAVNDESAESDVDTGSFETSGVGDAGEGGVVVRILDEFVHTFAVGDRGETVYEFTPPEGVDEVEALVVAGGGPGGYYAGGGGGAGGLVHETALAVTPLSTYTITVGTGGVASASTAVYGSSGGDSSIVGTGVSVTAAGGGAGANGLAANGEGVAGGSGGGSAFSNKAAGVGTSGQGNDGGQGYATSVAQAGGGGGANGAGGAPAAGGTGIVSSGGGGSGVYIDISGTSTAYGGGGGGGGGTHYSSTYLLYGAGGTGGDGGGGAGGQYAGTVESAIAASGTPGTGGGGGGGSGYEADGLSYYTGGDGGSGIVIIRYGAGGDGDGVVNPTISLTGLSYDDTTGEATVSYRVGWAGDGYDFADVSAIWGYAADALVNTNAAASDAIGQGSGTVALPRVTKTVYIRLVAENAGGYTGISPETLTLVLVNPAAPAATVSVPDAAYTNATFSAAVASLGTGAARVDGVFQVCADAFFDEGTYETFPISGFLSEAGTLSETVTGLLQSSTLWVRASLTNNLGYAYETDPVSFTTLTPARPAVEATLGTIGFTTVSGAVTVSDLGAGSGSALLWIEASATDDFASPVRSPLADADAGAALSVTVPGLAPAGAYHLRAVASNWWGLVSYAALPDVTLRDVPFSASGIVWTDGGDGTLDFTFPVSAVFDGATLSAVLSYGGGEAGTRTCDAAATLSWSGVAAGADGAVAQVVVTATVDGTDYVRTWSVPVASGATATTVSSVANHASAVDALWMRPGDVAILPETSGNGFYQVLNDRFATVDGNTLVALEPGIVGVRCVDASFNTNVMGVVILPEPIGNGNVYVYKETGRNGNVACDWSRPQCWDKVENGARAATNTGCPTNADDIAVLPFYNNTGDQYIRHCTDISVGGVYAGQIRPDTYVNCHMERYKFTDLSNKTEETAPHTVTFRRSDGQPVEIKVCPNSEGGNYSRFVLGGYNIDVVWASDAVIDGCSSETDVNGPRGRFYVKTAGSTNTLQGVTLTFQGYPGYAITGNGCTDTLKGVWKGTGAIVKKGFGGIAFDGDFSGFAGTVYERSGPNIGGMGGSAAGVLMRAAGASNVTAHVYGWIPYNQSTGVPDYGGQNRGKLGTGGASVAPASGAQGPAKGLYLHGGTYRANNIDNSSWGVGVADEKVFDVLSVGAGFSYFNLQNGAGNGSGKPINAVTAKTLAQSDKGTLVLYDPSINNNAATSVTNALFSVLDWADHAIGGAGNGENGASGATDDYAIVPWLASNGNQNGNFDWLLFPAVDANGRLVRPVRNATYIDTASGENANAICSDKYGSLTHGTATEIVVNSLFLNNASNGDRWLGANRTLTIKSGGLIFHSNGSAIGLPGRDDNGSLVLGDATHPAYVWNRAYGSYTNRIWAAVTAPGGFVSTYTGNLELGGAQTNIANEIVVDAGCLALGNSDYGISLAEGLPLRVCAGATLKLPCAHATGLGPFRKNPLKIDGSAGAFGKVELPVDQACRSLSVRDVFESDEWTRLPDGYYGSSEAAGLDNRVEFVRDDLFAGPGVLRAGTPAAESATLIVVW